MSAPECLPRPLEEGREGGREGRERGREGERDGGRERKGKGGRERGREGGKRRDGVEKESDRKGGKEGGREEGMEGRGRAREREREGGEEEDRGRSLYTEIIHTLPLSRSIHTKMPEDARATQHYHPPPQLDIVSHCFHTQQALTPAHTLLHTLPASEGDMCVHVMES